MAEHVIYDASHETERIAVLTIDNPKRRNALSEVVLTALTAEFSRIADEGRTNAVILRGTGAVYSSGHDLREILEGDAAEVLRLFEVCYDTMKTIRDIPQVVIAEVQGMATAAGCQLVGAADLAVASSEARFATPGVKIGYFCSTPAVFLSRNVGRKTAAQMLFTGEPIDALEAERHGLVNRVVPPGELSAVALELARSVARHSLSALGQGKRDFYRQLSLPDFDALAYATQVMATSSSSADAREGIRSFLEKRPPVWSDRQPAGGR